MSDANLRALDEQAESRSLFARLVHAFAWLTRPTAADEPHVVQAIERSVLVHTLKMVFTSADRLVRGSACGQVVQHWRDDWADTSARERSLAAGAMLLSAVLTFLAISVQSPPPGWMWLTIPVLALIVGVLLTASAPSASGSNVRD